MESYDQVCKEKHRLRILSQLSPALRDDSLVNALASLEAGVEYSSALNAFVSEQWALHYAAEKELRVPSPVEEVSQVDLYVSSGGEEESDNEASISRSSLHCNACSTDFSGNE